MKKIISFFVLILFLSCSSNKVVSNLYTYQSFSYESLSKEAILIVPPRTVNLSSENIMNLDKNQIKDGITKSLGQKLIKEVGHSNVFISDNLPNITSDLHTEKNVSVIQEFIKSKKVRYFVFIGPVSIGKRISVDQKIIGVESSVKTYQPNLVRSINVPIDIWGKPESHSLLSFDLSLELNNDLLKSAIPSNIDLAMDAVVDQIRLAHGLSYSEN